MYRRISHYYPGCDGTKLAVDLYLPETKEKVPVLFRISRNVRRPDPEDARGQEFFRRELAQFEYFLERGYAVAIPEMRGVGASYGTNEGFWSPIDGRDMAALIDAVAEEPWCNGNVGMFGGSNVGASQHFAAKNLPKHLRCIIPCDCSADLYYQNYPNGVSILPDMKMPKMPAKPGVPVDEDPAPDYPMAHAAVLGHDFNMGFLEQYLPDMHRDSINYRIGYAPNMEIPVWNEMDRVRFSGIAVYPYGAFYEPGCTNKIFEYRAWGGKLLLGPWRHCEVYQENCDFPEGVFDWKTDHLRWFDHFLKGEDNGVTEEPPVLYYTTDDEKPWHRSADFPLDDQTNPSLYLTAEGTLTESAAGGEAERQYRVRDDISIIEGMGRLNRRIDRDLREEAAKCLTFTTEVLPEDLELTGFPVVELYAKSTYSDGIFLAELLEILPDGKAHFLTDGMLRGRSAKLSRHPILDPIGVPYHSSLQKDDVKLSTDRPTFLAFHLESLSKVVKKGSRLQLLVHCGGNGYRQPDGLPADTEVTFCFGKDTPARLKLPAIAPHAHEFASGDASVFVFKKAVYRKDESGWKSFPCLQVYPSSDGLHYVTGAFTAVRKEAEGRAQLTIKPCEAFPDGFRAEADLPKRLKFINADPQITGSVPPEMKAYLSRSSVKTPTTFKNLYVATVPVAKGQPGDRNPQMCSTFDLFTDLILPKNDPAPGEKFPCVVHIHGFGGNNHQYESWSQRFLDEGAAVASIDYRLMPPGIWPVSAVDAAGCIRYLKAHADELHLDPDRFALIGGSMGGHLTAWLSAVNGQEEIGDIGGNTEYDTSVRAAVALFAPTDLFGFGEDCAAQWPHQPDKVANADGPFAPVGSMIGYAGPGKGMGKLKTHLNRPEEPYRSYIELAKEASAVTHVTGKSAPLCLVHGMFDCGIQVPMGQSLRMFEALTRAGVKSLCLLNNNGIYGDDPEVQRAMGDFILSRL